MALESDFNMGYRVIGLAEIDRLNATVEASTDGLALTRSAKDPITKKEYVFPLVHGKQDFLNIIEETKPYFVLALEPGELSKYQSFVSEVMLHTRNFSIIPPLKGVPLVGAEISPIRSIGDNSMRPTVAKNISKTRLLKFAVQLEMLVLTFRCNTS